METFSALLALCAGNSPVSGEFPTQRPVTRSFDVFFDLRLNKRLSKQWWGWWFETLSRPLWCHRNDDCNGGENNERRQTILVTPPQDSICSQTKIVPKAHTLFPPGFSWPKIYEIWKFSIPMVSHYLIDNAPILMRYWLRLNTHKVASFIHKKVHRCHGFVRPK